jgi:hypothetical protein
MNPEKLYFRRSLIYPQNCLGSGLSFLGYSAGTAKLRLYRAFKPPHVWTKVRPPWLSSRMIRDVSREIAAEVRELSPASAGETAGACSGLRGDAGSTVLLQGWPEKDPERYWHIHRWGWLLERHENGVSGHDDVISWMETWIRQERERSDPAWEPFSCCERIAAIFTLFMSLPEERRDRVLAGPIRPFILESAGWIINHLEYYGPQNTNNHILNNGRALAMAGALAGNRNIITTAMRIFRNMLPVIVSEKGFLRERSSHYQILVLRWLLDSEKALSFKKDLSSEGDRDFIRGYAKRMSRASALMCDEKGMIKVLIGDVSPDARPDEACRSLNELYPQWRSSSAEGQSGYAGDGWFFLRHGKLEVITNQPEKYPVPHSNHGHADIAGFVFLFDGRPVLIDPGRNNYTRDSLARRFFGGAFHNVPLVDGIAPAITPFFKKWVPEQYGSVRVRCGLEGDHVLKIEHDGFRRLGIRILHTRSISMRGNTLCVTDEFSGRGEHEITLCWHFPPGFKHGYSGPGNVSLLSSFCTVTIGTAGRSKDGTISCPVSLAEGSDDGGWYAPAYGTVQQALTVHMKGSLRFPATVSTTFEVGHA